MAKPLGPKSTLIREAIQAHPRAGNKKLAETINGAEARKDDGIEVTPAEIAKQRQQLKAGAKGRRSGNGEAGKRDGTRAAANGKAPSAAPTAAPVGVVELIDEVFSLAHKCGGLPELKRLVDRLAEAR